MFSEWAVWERPLPPWGAQLRPGPSVFKMVLAIARMNVGCLNEREDFPVVLCYMGPRVAVWL